MFPVGQYYNLYDLALFEANNPRNQLLRSDGSAAETFVLGDNPALIITSPPSSSTT